MTVKSPRAGKRQDVYRLRLYVAGQTSTGRLTFLLNPIPQDLEPARASRCSTRTAILPRPCCCKRRETGAT